MGRSRQEKKKGSRTNDEDTSISDNVGHRNVEHSAPPDAVSDWLGTPQSANMTILWCHKSEHSVLMAEN